MSPFKIILKVFLVAAIVMGVAWQHIEAVRLGYQVEKSRHEEDSLKSNIANMQVTLETNLSCSHLAVVAKQKLGMMPPSINALKILETSPIPITKHNLWGWLKLPLFFKA